MILSCHQPQYLPWLGYFDKIQKSDIFVFLDNVQYKKREYQNRNQIKTKDGPQWLTVPVQTKHKYEQLLCDVKIDNSLDWRRSNWHALEVNYGRAGHFDEHRAFFENLYAKDWDGLAALNKSVIQYVIKYLGIGTPVDSDSRLSAEFRSTDRIIEICRSFNADTYLSGAGGRAYLEEEKFSGNNITLVYQDFKHPEYGQLFGDFIPYMSVIDLLFNHGKDSINILKKKE